MYGAPRPSEGRKPQESWRSGDGSTHLNAPQYPEARAGLDVKPPEGERGGTATQSECQVIQEHTLEGRNPRRYRRLGSLVIPVTERTRRRNKALQQATEALVTPRGGRRGRVTAGGQGPREGYRLRRGEHLEG
jgi:hypothetical protein